MTELYLIRHAEAEGNLYRRMDGSYDSAVTGLGQKQIEALGRRFRDIPLNAVYSSDLCRTMETAAVLCRDKRLPLRVDPRLREVCVGPWEDLPFGTVAADDPEEFHRFSQDPPRWHLAGADTYEAVAKRAIAALTDIARAHPGGRAAVCAHGFLIGAALGSLFYGGAGMGGRSANTAVTLLRYEAGAFSLVYSHDASHLPPELRRRTPPPPDLCIRPMASDAAEEYIRYRGDAWALIYGNLRDFDGPGFWLDAQRTVGQDPEAMAVGYDGPTPVGMIQLSPRRDAEKGVGYIPFLYLRQPYRHQGLGIQLVGHAVSFYRKLGRTRLQLSVAPTNENAIRFYRKYGFSQVKKQRGRYGHLLLMEKDIAMPQPPRDIPVEAARYPTA